jgi:hypothetical protein
MSMTRALAPLFVMLLLAAPGALAKSTALEAAPADTDFGLVIHGLGQLEPMLDEHVDTMKHYGLDAPDIEMFLDMIRDTSPRLKKTRGPLAAELGLTETGSLAIYALPGEAHAPQVVAVMDVKERKKVIKTVKWLLALDPTSDKSGKAKAKIKVKKERLPGKGLLMTFQKADSETSLYLRFQGDLAAFSDNLKAIDAVQFAGGEPFLGSGVLADARIGFYAGLNTAGAIAMKMLPPAAASVKTAQLYTLFQGGRYEAKLDVEVEPDFEPFLSVLRPGASGKAARAAMSKLITERTDAWWRISLDLKALETLASNLLGKGYEKIEAKFERRTGLPLDLVNRSITGDQLVRCDGSFSSCVFTAGILDAGGAENLIRHFFAIVGDGLTENSTQEVSVETKSVSEAGEARHMVTTLSIRENLEKKAELLKEAHEWLRMDEKQRSLQDKLRAPQTEEEKKNNKAEPFQPILSIHWGMTDKLVIFGTTPQAIQTAMKASSESAPAASGGKLDDLTFVGGYQARGGLSDVIRQAVPVLRGLLPKDFIGGSVIRMIDGLLVLHDEAVDGESSMRVSPTNVTLHGVATSLPTKGQKDYSATISEAYTQAMRDRYAGDIAQSNELLAKLALEHPNTPWGQKAKGMVFRTDLTGMFVNLGYLGALGNNPIAHKLIRQMEQAIAPMIRGF